MNHLGQWDIYLTLCLILSFPLPLLVKLHQLGMLFPTGETTGTGQPNPCFPVPGLSLATVVSMGIGTITGATRGKEAYIPLLNVRAR